ncbi:hypothetical protein ACFOMD_02910 [Sphingoaurantiacus capsulatus]|uniref:Holin n=1 Tax=Sphingoaurantiacus capsulatus TaxID=1771310 RepID=A0ABV7X870_9SPHN
MDKEATKKKSELSRGGLVIVATGWAAFAALAQHAETNFDYALMAAIVAATAAGGWAMNRLVARHGDEIGEARFDTRNDR